MSPQINNNNVDFFSSEVSSYEHDYWRTDEEFIAHTWFTIPQGRILVLGCGAGRTLPYLHKHNLAISAIDFSPEMILQARQKFSSVCDTIEVMDATKLTFADNSFDYVFFPFHGIDNITPDKKPVLQEVSRVLKPSGIFIFSSHNWLSIRHWRLWLSGRYASYHGLLQARSTPFDSAQVKKYFRSCQTFFRISLRPSNSRLSYKDRLFYLLPFFDKSLYFICQHPKK
jgi:ubiquinone/menaquinone biosynthesis C-methylase UbiE